MGTITLRVRSIGSSFAAGAVLSAAVTLMFINAWRVDAAPGDSDATLVPITPCRLVDTRQPGQAPLSDGEIRKIEAHGTNGPIVGSECTIPTHAVGLSMNVTAVGASVRTFWTIWPTGAPQPEASSLNPEPGQPPTPNAVTTSLSGGGEFNVFNNNGTVGMLIDVNGYYTDASLQELAERLTAVETAQAVGVDPTVLARLTALETDTATNTNDIATNTAGIATNAAGIAGLDAAQPFAVSSRDEQEFVRTEAKVIVSVTVTAPVDGRVVVNSTTSVDGGFVIRTTLDCSITTGDVLVDSYRQRWSVPGNDTGGENAQLAATRWFILSAGLTRTYNLVCASTNTSILEDSVLTATFTPAP